MPEGFFDDPIQDAKARGIEYKVKKSERQAELRIRFVDTIFFYLSVRYSVATVGSSYKIAYAKYVGISFSILYEHRTDRLF